MGSSGSFGTRSREFSTRVPVNDITYFLQPTGKWFVMEFLMTFISFIVVSAARTLILCKSWTANRMDILQMKNFNSIEATDLPINPPNRLNVRGIRVCGFTSMSTFLAVWMYTCSKPARFNGESNSINSDWWVMSGRQPAGSLLFRRIMLMWSSQFSNSNVLPTCEQNINSIQSITAMAVKTNLHCFELGPFQDDNQSFFLRSNVAGAQEFRWQSEFIFVLLFHFKLSFFTHFFSLQLRYHWIENVCRP